MQDVAAGRAVDLDRHRAVVDVEERPVGAQRVEPQVVLGQLLDDVVDVGLAVVHPLASGRVFSMTPCSGRRDFCSSRSDRSSADASGGIAPAIGSRSLASPVISCCSWSTLALNCAPFASTVPSTVLRLLITSPMSWSRAASVWVKTLVLDSRFDNAPPWPCSSFDDGVADLVDLVAVQALEHRAQSAEQRVEVQRRLGVALGDRRARRQLAQFTWARRDLQVPVTDQVLVADHRAGGRVQLVALVDVECHVDGVVRVELDRS